MGLSRRFLNLIVNHHDPGARSLSCIDLKRLQLFKPTTPSPTRTAGGSQAAAVDSKTLAAATVNQKNKQAANGNLKNKQAVSVTGKQKSIQLAVAEAEAVVGLGSTLEKIRLPSPSFTFQASSTHGVHHQWNICCLPFADRKVLCTDQCGRAFLFDADTRHVETMPTLHKPKLTPFSVFIPRADGGGSLFLMESLPQPESWCSIKHPCNDFEVLVYCKDSMTWRCQPLPPPPYIYDPTYWNTSRSKISSYAVVDGDDSSLICISVNGMGTYCLDTVNHTWSKLGEWTLPFYGKVEYVPELKLWFGLSSDGHHLAAADLSTMDAQPQLVVSWEELNPREEWMKRQDTQVVNLGSGRFCIARFFKTWVTDDHDCLLFDQSFAVLTGVEVFPCISYGNVNGSGNGNVKLEMKTHKSCCHVSTDYTSIEELF